MSAPNPPVRSMAAWIRRAGVVKSPRLSVWSAPKGRAGHAVRAALPRADAQLAPEADGTATTREEINERDSVTLTQRLTGGVKRDARAEALDLAAHLVTKRQIAGQGTVYFLHLAAPDVQIGPADTGARELDQDRAGLGVRHRIFAQLELAAVRLEHRDTSLHVRAPSFPR